MPTPSPATVEEFLASLPEDRLPIVTAIREAILANIDARFAEGMQYGGIGYFVPHSLYPKGYHCDPRQPLPFIGLTNTKGHVGLHLFCLYLNTSKVEEFQEAFRATGKKLDMGKSCVRFKKLDGVPLELIGETIKGISLEGFIATYEGILKK